MASSKLRNMTCNKNVFAIVEKYMDEADLSIKRKKEILNRLNSLESCIPNFPVPDEKNKKTFDRMRKMAATNSTNTLSKKLSSSYLWKQRYSKRRKETILQCGYYDIEPYQPKKEIIDRDVEIQKLQDIMYGLSNIEEDGCETGNVDNPSEKCRNEMTLKFEIHDRIKELMIEVEDRINFLKEMEKFGLKKRYEFEITNEISQKIKQLEHLSKIVDGQKKGV